MGAGLFGGAGALGFYALGAFTAFAILALDDGDRRLAGRADRRRRLRRGRRSARTHGKNKVTAATPPVPEQAVDSTKEDVRWVKTRATSAR